MQGREPRIIVVGAGIGGLVSAVDLAAAGCRVRLLERGAKPGGKVRVEHPGGVEVGAGPTVLTMPWVFDEIFDAVGRSFRGEVALTRAEIVARHAWADGTRLDLHAEREASADAIGRVFGRQEADAYRAFCVDARRIYETVEAPFLRAQRPTLGSIMAHVGAIGIGAFRRIDGVRSMWRALSKRFAAPQLRQLFGRYATYCGSSPFEAPATLNLIAHVEAEGVYRVGGGMKAVAAALERVAHALGVETVCDCEVARIVVDCGRARGVVAAGTLHEADAIVFNGDVSALGSALLGRDAARSVEATPFDTRSLSAVTWAFVARTEGFPLLHHNVFFSSDYAAEFDAIARGGVPPEPTVYVCAQDRADVGVTLPAERLLALVNAPPSGATPARWTEAETSRCTLAMLATLRRCGLTLAPQASIVTTPADFEHLFPGTGGALYGPKSRGPLAALTRQAAASRIPGLYLAGGSVHPGPGVPMAALSGRLAAKRICADLASTARFRTAATSGTTSTA